VAASSVPAPTSATDGFDVLGTTVVANGRVTTKVGCLKDLSATTLEAAFRRRVGPLIGWDNPHIYPLGNGRRLWLVHDSYLDYQGGAQTLHDRGPQIQNLAFVQQGTCFTLIHRGTQTNRLNFEPGIGAVPGTSFFWPLGGALHRSRLQIFWGKMEYSVPRPGPGDGLTRHPVSTWLATYNPKTLERVSFERAPNAGVFPQYGFAVESTTQHTYLFGNSNLLNLDREGGFYNGPHSATKMYLARVPLGRLEVAPSYRTADGWSSEASDAVPISSRFFVENTMQPRRFGDRWISVAKVDGFWGSDVVIDVADKPWGPWRTVRRFEHQTRYGNDIMNSYQPILLPWVQRSGQLGIVISENARSWPEAVANPALYRPSVMSVPFPP